MSTVTMREMLEAGVHFGHQTRYWNPQMAPYLFGQRNKIHIINLEHTLPLFNDAVNFVSKLASKKGKILFVGTKRAAQKIIQEEAQRCGMPYVNKRWLGGLLTNFKTVKQSINRLKTLEELLEGARADRISKKETLQLNRELHKLQLSLSGIKDMPVLPDAMFVIDVGYEDIAISEAAILGIPVVGVVDSNNSPKGVDYVIPGNDDAIRSIRLYARVMADAINDGQVSVAHLMEGQSSDEFVELDESGAPVTDKKTPRTKKKTVRKKTVAPADDATVENAAAATDAVAAADEVTAEQVVATGTGTAQQDAVEKAPVAKNTTKKKLTRKKTSQKTAAEPDADTAVDENKDQE
jgi:small subunit ribosomal protein S2